MYACAPHARACVCAPNFHGTLECCLPFFSNVADTHCAVHCNINCDVHCGDRNGPSGSDADKKNVTSDCSTKCFFQTVVGKSESFPNITGTGMTAEELVAPWTASFESNNPAEGGCPAL